MSFVTLQTYTYPHEMAIVQSLLESEGIKTVAMNEIIAQINPGFNVGGGIKLMVQRKDFDPALAILFRKGLIETKSTALVGFTGLRNSGKIFFLIIILATAAYIFMEILEILKFTRFLGCIN